MDKFLSMLTDKIKWLLADKRRWLIALGALLLVIAIVVTICIVAGGSNSTPTQNEQPDSSMQQDQNNQENQDNQDSQDNQENQDNQDNQEDQKDEPVLNYVHPLTGEALAEPMLQRPVAIMLNNIRSAMPQHGVSQADILYEVLAEGGITRCMGIYTDVASVEKIGAIRSARLYYVQIAQGYSAYYVHAGGSTEAKNYLGKIKNMDLDAGKSATYFYRDKDRLNAGYSLEHTLFSSGEKILGYAQQLNVTTAYEEEKSYGMTFDDDKVIVGQSAEKVGVYFNMGGNPGSGSKCTSFTYNPETKTYFAFQSGNTHGSGSNYIDGNNKETIAFRNIVVLRMKTVDQNDKSHHLTVTNVGSGEGYFACNGQIVPIKWSRASVNEPFAFTLENGNPVTFGVGSTYIGVVPTGATVTFE